MTLPYRPRWLNRLVAFVCGYFWLPCPLCGEDFGGHEWREWGHTLHDGSSGKGTCPRCPVEAALEPSLGRPRRSGPGIEY